ncbi:hypothetical protein BDQ12DRAFT_609947 [Crucibulum laeve]|uniref:TauD/TfdA-like domain-containing protein n=1 Tax=Crucibulum laeve TaxID=68775 RepID=A0A5C3LTW8_9AGAR|nr:hypothetical protein BDQ12DRAFT_609947 [Crucibulum laeve]
MAPTSSTLAAPLQPDIEYHPNEEKWRVRTARRLAEDPLLPTTPLPRGFPQKLESPLVWKGSDWMDESQWVYELNESQLKEIDDAVKYFNALNQPLGYVSPTTFPLPTLSPILSELSKELHTGRGFFVLRTIPVSSYSKKDAILIYTGLSSHVGSLRGVQDHNNAIISHIKDLRNSHPEKTIGSPAYTTDKQVYHTDIGDIIALFAFETAHEGGTSRISSSWQVYNDLAASRPDLIQTLAEPWPLDGLGGTPAYSMRPLLFYEDSKIIIQYVRRLFTGFHGISRSTNIPPITEAQAEALDAIHFYAEKVALGLNFQKGDIQFINNLSIFHGRDAFVDTPEKTRHLLRLWLRNEELAWKIPTELQPTWDRVFYKTSLVEQQFPVEPEMLLMKGAKYA